jgi:4-alpha-glucanotransferase
MAVGAIPGLEAEDVDQARAELGEEAIAAGLVEYAAVRIAKRKLLRIAYGRFSKGGYAAETREFESFEKEEANWLDDYSLFRALMERAGDRESWDLWPDAYNEGHKAREFLASERASGEDRGDRDAQFYRWVQWLCFRQWRAVRDHADRRGVKLMGDIPIGISYYSADVFFQSENFDLAWCGGAPPEMMFKHDRFIQRWGQNWGIPLYRWDDMEREGFPWWQQRIRKLTEIFHIFRIDHILGFYRIYSFPWRPQRNQEFIDLSEDEARKMCHGRLPGWAWRADDSEENKRANRQDGDRRLRAIIAAAEGSEIVGEDLGCVPDYVRPHLESLSIAGFRIPHWESRDGHVVAGDDFPECSFATYSTHDHDTIAALWQGYHHAATGISTRDAGEMAGARWNLRMLTEFSGLAREKEACEFDLEIQWGLIAGLMRSRSRYAAIMITDLFGMQDRYNRPGTVGGENWRFRLPFTLEEMQSRAALANSALLLREVIQETSRG